MSKYQIKEYDVPEGLTEEEVKEIAETVKIACDVISKAFINFFDALSETFSKIGEIISEVKDND